MRYILIFDTETTGLLPKYFSNNDKNILSNLSILPYIVQFSCILFDSKTMKILDKIDSIIKIPDNAVVSEDSTKVHGITKEDTKKGVDIITVLDKFNELFKSCDLLVAHNLQFDSNILKIEYLRNNRDFIDLRNKEYYCTMQNSKNLCNLEATNSLGTYIKFPKLDELHNKLFNVIPQNLHNSYYDIIISLRCFLMLTNNVDLFKYNKELKNIYETKIEK